MDHHQHHPHQSHHHRQQHHNNQQHQQHQHQQHHQQQQQSQSHPMYTTPHMIPIPNYSTNNNNNNNRFPFNSSLIPTPETTPPQQQQQQQQSVDNSPYSDIDPNSSQKKKRGRPRKYSPDNATIALGLSPTPLSSAAAAQMDSSENSSRKNRGRPPSSSKKQLDALGNCGVGFTPHVILVNAGEDIASKILDFSKQGERTICVLSANGSICNVDLHQPAKSGGVVKYEGRFEIISLSGSFLFSENSGGQVRTGGLSVSMAGPEGRVLGGGVVGVLRAATPVQIIVGSFIADGKKPKYMPSVPQSHMTSFSGPTQPVADRSPISQEVSTEGSDDNGSNHIDRNTGSYANSDHHPMHHNMQMYSQMNWPNPGSKMHQN